MSALALKPFILKRQLRSVAKLCQGLRVGQRVGVFHRFAVYHIAHRQFDDLTADGARDIADSEDLRRYMAWCGIGADHLADLLFEGVIQLDAIVESHEQHDSHIVLPALANGQAFQHLRDFSTCR